MSIENSNENFLPKEGFDEQKILELKNIVDRAFGDGAGYFSDPVQNFFRLMKSKYSPQELTRCRLWHTLILSTPNGSETTFDMPEGEIEDFIRNTVAKL